ncbi:hypothetical protein RRF57_012926 [Xylaria bambusicola]|uniref:Uncharacterized protein n=1 Tax=Xylaria bambusicola TaxID=326684 RepID=A0AAN7V4R2_9PEZI
MNSPSQNYNGLGRQPVIFGITWALTSVCILTTAARVYTRTRVLDGLLSEDWLMLLATEETIKIYHPHSLVNVLKWVWLPTILDWWEYFSLEFQSQFSLFGFLVLKDGRSIEGLWNPQIPAKRRDPKIELYLAFFSQSK